MGPASTYYTQATTEKHEGNDTEGMSYAADRGKNADRTAREKVVQGPIVPPISIQEKLGHLTRKTLLETHCLICNKGTTTHWQYKLHADTAEYNIYHMNISPLLLITAHALQKAYFQDILKAQLLQEYMLIPHYVCIL